MKGLTMRTRSQAIDKYLNVELIMNMGTNDERRRRVMNRRQELDGEPIGHVHANPLFDTREYEVEFTDGTNEKYQANVIAKNIFAQVDSEGNQYLLVLHKLWITRKTTAPFQYLTVRYAVQMGSQSPRLQ
jgi:hypothetical protein